ncbi:MAG: hypothetical protein H7246_13095 [Phycisphaerae bacterium]|nr:hypothetical protein [Saprospiraceae bacterium]
MRNNRSIFALLTSIFMLLVASNNLVAQTEMRWDTHGVGFTVPDDFKVTTNNAEEYTASNDNLVLSIAPIQDENIEKEHLSEVVLAMATEMHYDALEEADEINIDDFTGYYIKGKKDGVNAVVMALLDKKSSTNLVVVIAYDDDYFDEAVAIASSFVAYD